MISVKNIHSIFFDFDGVLTDNFVYLNDKGEELVKLNRADGLAFNALNYLKIPTYIFSSESNKVVRQRASM